ncbi:MAG: ABC transporter permease [Acidimicrobiales bacterium]
MFSLTVKGLWAHKLRYALTGLAVVLGVAFMAGTMVLTDTMEETFNGVFESANDGTDVIVRRSAAIEGEFADARDRVDASVVTQVAAVDGVAVARGSVQAFTQLVRADGEAADTTGLGTTLGTNWIDDERLNPFTIASGDAPGAGEVVIDQHTADVEGWSLGDEITVLTKEGPASLALVGTATYGDIGGLPGTTVVATDDDTAQALFAEPGRFDSIVISAASGVPAAELTERLASEAVTAANGLEVLTGEQDTADQQASFKEDLSFFSTFLMAFAYIALFVGTFIIYNTFSIVVAQRMKDLALLRAIGARRSQVLRSIVLESVLIGVIAAAVGLAAGIGLSFGLRALLSGVGLDIPSGPIVVSSGTIITAFVVGAGVSIVSAVMPAVRASRVKPIAALRDVAIDRSGVSLGRVGAGLALTAAGIIAFAAGIAGDGSSAVQVLGLGTLLVLLGVIVLGPVLVGPAFGVLGAVATRVSGITGRYAGENARRTPKRAAATASALMIGVALVGFITIIATSTSASVESAIDRSFRADYVIESGSWTQGFGTSIEGDLAEVAEIETMSPLRTAPAEIDGSSASLLAVDTTVFEQLYDLDITAGSLADVNGDGVAVQAEAAAGRNVTIGDRIPIRFADGTTVDSRVAAIFDGQLPAGGDDWVVGLDTFETHVDDQFDRQVYVSVADGVSATESRAAIDSAIGHWANAEVQDQAEFKEAVTAEIDQMLNLIYGLLALAVVIALIGIANTLALSVHERTRELGLLRAIGMHRRQLKAAVRWESFLIAILGTVLGTTLAVAGAWGIVQTLDSEGITQLTLPVGRLAVIMVMAGVAGVLAATGPARRAAKLDILTAISTD